MVDVDEFHGELARPHGFARLHGEELGALGQAVLLQLEPDQAGGKAGAVDGHVDLLEHVRMAPTWSSWPWVMNSPRIRRGS